MHCSKQFVATFVLLTELYIYILSISELALYSLVWYSIEDLFTCFIVFDAMFCGWLPIYVIRLQTFITLTFVTISFWYISFISASLLLFAYCLQLYLVTPTWEFWRRICSSCWSLFLNGLPLYSFVISLQTYIYIYYSTIIMKCCVDCQCEQEPKKKRLNWTKAKDKEWMNV